MKYDLGPLIIKLDSISRSNSNLNNLHATLFENNINLNSILKLSKYSKSNIKTMYIIYSRSTSHHNNILLFFGVGEHFSSNIRIQGEGNDSKIIYFSISSSLEVVDAINLTVLNADFSTDLNNCNEGDFYLIRLSQAESKVLKLQVDYPYISRLMKIIASP